MSKIRWIAIGAAILLLVGLMFPPHAALITQMPNGAASSGDPVKNKVIDRIMAELAQCESGNDPDAVNEYDLDGTASYGLYQFKPSTLLAEGMRFGVFSDIEPAEIMNVIYDRGIQTAVARAMISERGNEQAFWDQQFPGCGEKYRFWEYLEKDTAKT